ncbi:uncharacterized protein [Miscanthus floridulus]
MYALIFNTLVTSISELSAPLFATANTSALLSILQRMAILCPGRVAPSVHHNFLPRWLLLNNSSRMYGHVFPDRMKPKRQNRHQRMACFSKGSSFQDLVPSVKPSRLLPAEELKTYPNTVPEEIFNTTILDDSDAFYVLELSTSTEFNSSLDKNSAILICLIDVDGDSLLQRVPAIYLGQPTPGIKIAQLIPFQSGSVDVVTFKGSKLKRIKEVWIGLESGSWRLDGLSLKVIHGPVDPPKEINGTPEQKFNGLQYIFEKINAFLGDDGASVAEARPVAVTDLSGVGLSDLQEGLLSSESKASSVKELREDGLREYADLKQSLLLYDASIVITGFSAFILASNDSAAYSFLIGGIVGFLYLLLLQRSVDGLPVIGSPSEAGSAQPSVKGFSGVRRPWLILSLVLVAGAVALKYGAGGDSFELTPTELFVGTAGFLANKVAVLFAAFMPLLSDSKSEDGSGDSN